jgi:hypothetical protein
MCVSMLEIWGSFHAERRRGRKIRVTSHPSQKFTHGYLSAPAYRTHTVHLVLCFAFTQQSMSYLGTLADRLS